MIYAWDNNSTQNAHIKHSNDNKQKSLYGNAQRQ